MMDDPAIDTAPEGFEEPEVEWTPVVRWPEQARSAITDIEKIRHIIELMAGTADDQACQVFTDFLHAALLGRQRELALAILGKHGIELPEPGTMQTPQQRMSAGLAHIADEIRSRRPDLVPEHQPFTDRAGARRHPPPQD
jgi:hypothetical protein